MWHHSENISKFLHELHKWPIGQQHSYILCSIISPHCNSLPSAARVSCFLLSTLGWQLKTYPFEQRWILGAVVAFRQFWHRLQMSWLACLHVSADSRSFFVPRTVTVFGQSTHVTLRSSGNPLLCGRFCRLICETFFISDSVRGHITIEEHWHECDSQRLPVS